MTYNIKQNFMDFPMTVSRHDHSGRDSHLLPTQCFMQWPLRVLRNMATPPASVINLPKFLLMLSICAIFFLNALSGPALRPCWALCAFLPSPAPACGRAARGKLRFQPLDLPSGRHAPASWCPVHFGDEADSRTMSSQKKACNYRAHRCNSHLQNCIDTVQLNLLIIDSQSKLTINQAQTKTKPSSHQSNQEIIKSYQGVRSLKPAI